MKFTMSSNFVSHRGGIVTKNRCLTLQGQAWLHTFACSSKRDDAVFLCPVLFINSLGRMSRLYARETGAECCDIQNLYPSPIQRKAANRSGWSTTEQMRDYARQILYHDGSRPSTFMRHLCSRDLEVRFASPASAHRIPHQYRSAAHPDTLVC